MKIIIQFEDGELHFLKQETERKKNKHFFAAKLSDTKLVIERKPVLTGHRGMIRGYAGRVLKLEGTFEGGEWHEYFADIIMKDIEENKQLPEPK